MSKAFKAGDPKIIAVESAGTSRQLIIDVLKACGYSNIRGTANIKDALEIMEVEQIDWVVCPLSKEEVENGMSLLKLCTSLPQLHDTQVSLLLEATEQEILPTAFELGLFSYHKKPFTKDSLSSEFKAIAERIKSSGGRPGIAAAHELRRHLKEKDQKELLLEVEKRLMNLYPDQSDLLLPLAEAQILNGEVDEGRKSLAQLMLVDAKQEDQINKLKEEYADQLGSEEESGKLNVLSLKKVLVVDNDDAVHKTMKEIFDDLGVEELVTMSDGESAIKWIEENPDPDLIVQEWRIPKISGPIFLQKAMAAGAASTPFVVSSALVKENDGPFLKEMGVAAMVEKPLSKDLLVQKLIWTVQQDRQPNEAGTMERKIRNLIKVGKSSEANEMIKAYLENPAIPKSKKLPIEAEQAFDKKDLVRCRDLCIQSIKKNGDSLLVLNLLGKTLMLLKEFEAALKCLKKAQDMSPQNIERLCAIAEVQSELGDAEASAATLDKAKSLDKDNATIKSTELSIAVNSGDTDAAKKMMAQLDSMEDFVSFLNNRAVAYARCGQIDEGIDQYRKVLKVLDEDSGKYRAMVLYNLALAYARGGELDEAKMYAEKALKAKEAPDRIKRKSQSMISRIDKALSEGSFFELSESGSAHKSIGGATAAAASHAEDAAGGSTTNGEVIPIMSESESAVSLVLSEPGRRGCHLIYASSEKPSELTKELMSRRPRFKARDAISREATGGADKLFKAG